MEFSLTAITNRLVTEAFCNGFLTSWNVRNVVKIYDYGSQHDSHYFTMMEYVDGPDFQDLVPRAPREFLPRRLHRNPDRRPRSTVEFQHFLNTWIPEI